MLARTDTVTGRGTPAVDHVNEVGTFDGHKWGLSHGHGQQIRRAAFNWLRQLGLHRATDLIGGFQAWITFTGRLAR